MKKNSAPFRTCLPVLLLSAWMALAPAGARASGTVIILDYHSFTGKGTSLDYTEKELSAQLDRFASLGYGFVSMRDAIEGRIEGSRNLVITIDDGNHTVYPTYLHVMKPRGIKPLLFIYPAIIGKLPYALTEAHLKEFVADGCIIGAHGYNHEYLTHKAYVADPQKVAREINKPGPVLESMLGKPVKLFGFPFGVSSPEAQSLLKAAGYDWAFLAGGEIHSVNFADPALDHYAVPRTIVFHSNIDAIYKTLESGGAK
jgi:peptidoglycan/xylan/chitin deacetylase (PgdA/CDA1 family)